MKISHHHPAHLFIANGLWTKVYGVLCLAYLGCFTIQLENVLRIWHGTFIGGVDFVVHFFGITWKEHDGIMLEGLE